MTEIYSEFFTVMAIFLRVIGFVISSPLVGTKFVPTKAKIFLTFLLTIFIFCWFEHDTLTYLSDVDLVFVCFSNLLMGLLFGTMLNVAYTFFTVGGHIIAMGSGLGFATMADPQNGTQITTLANFYKIIGSLLFVQFGGLLVMFMILKESIVTFPLDLSKLPPLDFEYIIVVFTFCLESALLLAAPMVLIVLLVNLAFGVISKASPSLNVFSIGFPVGIWITFLFMFLTIDNLGYYVQSYISKMAFFVLGV